MAFNPLPAALIANYGSNGVNITIPIASLRELSAAEANQDTGDWRKLLFALIEEAYQKQQATAAADRSGKVTIERVTNTNDAVGTATRVYKIQFSLQEVGMEVAAEG